MITSGFLKRNFLNQTGDFDLDWIISSNNTTGQIKFGISGSNDVYAYTLNSGELYDPYGNILGSYLPNESVNLKNIIVNTKDTLYLNNEIQFYYKTGEFFNSDYNYNYFFVYTKDCIADFSFYLNGENTSLSILSQNKRYKNENTNEDFEVVTGRIYNSKPDLNVKIFNINIIGNYSYKLYNTTFPLDFKDYIDIYFKPLSGDINYSNKNISLNLDTNFGFLSTSIYITGEFIPLQFENFSIFPDVQEINLTSNQFQDFNIVYGGNDSSSLKFTIDYISGATGIITGYLSGTGYYESYITGYVSGSGYISKNLENSTILSGYNSFTNRMEYEIFPGQTIEVKKFVYATGNVSGDYEIDATGFGTGYLYENIKSSGIVNKIVSGFVSYLNPGNVSFNVDLFTGTGIGLDIDGSRLLITGESISGKGIATLKYNGDFSGIQIPTEYLKEKMFTGNLKDKENQEIISDPYIATGFGYYTGTVIEGVVDYNFFKNFRPGYYYFYKNSNNISGSGIFQEDISSSIITGLNGLLSNQRKEDINLYQLTGSITGSENIIKVFLDYCSTGSNLIKYTITGKSPKIDYFIIDNGKVNNVSNELQFILLSATGQSEIQNNDLENINYLTGDPNGTGIRTRISHLGQTSSGSGYFSGLFYIKNLNISSGLWTHEYANIENRIEEYTSQSYNNKISINLNNREDTYFDNDSYVLFRFTGV